jgi:hypothetical protein
MTTTKIITNAIYFIGLITAIFLDINNFQFYYGIVFIAIQIIFIYAEYVITNRTISNEAQLIKTTSPFTLKDLFLVIPFIIITFVGLNLLFKWFTTKYLVTYISIGILSAIIQYLIVKGKTTATLLIDKNNLIINDLFVKTYNLETLNKISFDVFDETYILEFSNSKNIKIKKDDYRQDDLNKFIAVMTTKSNCNVALSDYIKTELTAANIKFGIIGS